MGVPGAGEIPVLPPPGEAIRRSGAVLSQLWKPEWLIAFQPRIRGGNGRGGARMEAEDRAPGSLLAMGTRPVVQSGCICAFNRSGSSRIPIGHLLLSLRESLPVDRPGGRRLGRLPAASGPRSVAGGVHFPGSMKTMMLALALVSLTNAQSDLRNRLTFSGGYARDIHSFCCRTYTAVSLGATYSYRLFHNMELEAGVVTALYPAPEIRGATYDIKPEDRFIWAPFGLRGILPLQRDRIELSAAAGGLYEKYSVSNPNPAFGLQSRDGWGGYFAGGAAIAIDRGRRVWLGASPRWYLVNANGGYAHDRWFVIAGDLGFRF